MNKIETIKDKLNTIMLLNSKTNYYVDGLDFFKLRSVKRSEKKDGVKDESK